VFAEPLDEAFVEFLAEARVEPPSFEYTVCQRPLSLYESFGVVSGRLGCCLCSGAFLTKGKPSRVTLGFLRISSTDQRCTRPRRNPSRAAKKRSGHSTWGMWPQSGMRASEPSPRRVTAFFACASGNTRSRSPKRRASRFSERPGGSRAPRVGRRGPPGRGARSRGLPGSPAKAPACIARPTTRAARSRVDGRRAAPSAPRPSGRRRPASSKRVSPPRRGRKR
jgi:hypothetical protein